MGLTHISVADHDTNSHINPFINEASNSGVLFIPAIEISCAVSVAKLSEIHILCYFPRTKNKPWNSSGVKKVLTETFYARESYISDMISRADYSPNLWRDARKILAAQNEIANDVVPGTHILKRYSKFSTSHEWDRIAEVREKTRNFNQPGISWPQFLEATSVIEIMHEAGAITVLAHPGRYKLDEKLLKKMIYHLRRYGLDGIEAGYIPQHNETIKMLSIAKEASCLSTIGSDNHNLNQSITSCNYPNSLHQLGMLIPLSDRFL